MTSIPRDHLSTTTPLDLAGIVDARPRSLAIGVGDFRLLSNCTKATGLYYALSLLQGGFVDVGFLGAADELVVPLSWSDGAGVTVEKRLTFTRGSYAVKVEQVVTNSGAAAWRGAEYAQLQRRSYPQERSMFDVDSYSFDGPVLYDGERSETHHGDGERADGKQQGDREDGGESERRAHGNLSREWVAKRGRRTSIGECHPDVHIKVPQ